MQVLKQLAQSNPDVWMAGGGLVIGLLFGALVARTNFCTMGGLSDLMNFGDGRRFRAWVLAAATALLGTQLLVLTGAVNVQKSMYLGVTFNWAGHIIGGLMFGFGMVFAGGCASRNLARVGGGDLRALVTLIVMGIFAYMTIGGVLGPVRSMVEQGTSFSLAGTGASTQSLGDIFGALSGMGAGRGTMMAAVMIVALAMVYCFRDADFRASGMHVVSGAGVGVLATLGWLVTGMAADELALTPVVPVSLTFVRPAGDTIEWLQRFTAQAMPSFGVATVIGAVAGAFVVARATGRFRVTTFVTPAETVRALFGAALMGIGGVMALGCTVGQAITGVSTLSLGAFVTFAAIVAGGVFGLRRLESIVMAEA